MCFLLYPISFSVVVLSVVKSNDSLYMYMKIHALCIAHYIAKVVVELREERTGQHTTHEPNTKRIGHLGAHPREPYTHSSCYTSSLCNYTMFKINR